MGPVPGPRGGGYYPEDTSENISRTFVVLVHACTCFFALAHFVCIGVDRFVCVSYCTMFPLMNVIQFSSNVLLRMSQSRTQQMVAQSLLILLFPTLNTNFMLHAIFVTGIAHGIHIAYHMEKVKSWFPERVMSRPFVFGSLKCTILFVCLCLHVQHMFCRILFYIGSAFWSLFLDARGPKALVRMYCICLVLFMLLPATNAVCAYCHGAAEQFGCRGSATDCPFNTGVVANTASTVKSGTERSAQGSSGELSLSRG